MPALTKNEIDAEHLREALRRDLARVPHRVEHADRGGQRVGDLLHRRRPRLLEVVAAHVDRVPQRRVVGAPGHHVHDQPAARLGREDVRAAGQVLLDDVVLRRAPQLGRWHALLFGVGDVEAEQPRRGGVDRHRRVHAVRAGCRRAACACGRGGRPARRPCRPRRAPAGGRGRSRSGWAGRRRSTARSGPWPGSCGRARSTPPPSSGPEYVRMSHGWSPWANCAGCRPSAAGSRHATPRRRPSLGQQSRYALPGDVDGAERGEVGREPLDVEQRRCPSARSRSTSATRATFDASVRRWNIDSPANSPPMATP